MAAKESNKNGITVDATFTSFEELVKEITKYQHENYVQLYRRDSRTIDAALRRAPNWTFNPSIKYSKVVDSSIHGGRNSNPSQKGKDHNSSKSSSCHNCGTIFL